MTSFPQAKRVGNPSEDTPAFAPFQGGRKKDSGLAGMTGRGNHEQKNDKKISL